MRPTDAQLFLYYFIADEYIAALENLATTNPTYYRIYALGEFTTLDKLVFTNWVEREFNPDDYKNLPLLCGLD